MKKVVTFGEIMLRLSPIGYNRFCQNDLLQATYGGAEANVAVSLANFGADVSFVTKLPDHAIGRGAANELRGFGVDTRSIIYGGDRIGIYYLEKGASERSSVCIYDRKDSSLQTASPTDFDWDHIFEGAGWFHFTGITPALSDNVAAICLEACKVSKKKGLTVSCDLNYRSKLWSHDKAQQIMTELCRYVDVCIANEEDAEVVFGIKATGTISGQYGPELENEGYKEVAAKLVEKFGFKKVAITLRKSFSASDNDWSALLYDGQRYYLSKNHHIHLVDRVGGGDSFGAGLIYALISGRDDAAALEFAVSASALKQTIEGDFNRVTIEEVDKITNGNVYGRISR